MAETTDYEVQFNFPHVLEPQADGATLALVPQQATWYLPDGRIAPVGVAPLTGSISGLIFLDNDEDALNSAGDGPFILGLQMIITDAASVAHTVTVSGVDGTYSAPNLPAGAASVDYDYASFPAGYEESTELTLPHLLTVVAGVDTPMPDLGMKPVGGGGA